MLFCKFTYSEQGFYLIGSKRMPVSHQDETFFQDIATIVIANMKRDVKPTALEELPSLTGIWDTVITWAEERQFQIGKEDYPSDLLDTAALRMAQEEHAAQGVPFVATSEEVMSDCDINITIMKQHIDILKKKLFPRLHPLHVLAIKKTETLTLDELDALLREPSIEAQLGGALRILRAAQEVKLGDARNLGASMSSAISARKLAPVSIGDDGLVEINRPISPLTV
jgi:hypothetical protein